MTQRSLALAAGLTPSYVRKMEDGTLHSVPLASAIVSLAHALHADQDELLAAAGRVPSPFDPCRPVDTSAFISAVRRLHSQH